MVDLTMTHAAQAHYKLTEALIEAGLHSVRWKPPKAQLCFHL